MDINAMIQQFQNISLIYLFFKAFAILLAFLYTIYAIVIFRQTQVMNQTLTVGRSALINFISFLQIVFGLALIALAIYTI